jgi:hypothetical protein
VKFEDQIHQEPGWNEIKDDRYKINTRLNEALLDKWERMNSAEKQPYINAEGTVRIAGG